MLQTRSYQKEAGTRIQPTNTKNSYLQSTTSEVQTEDGHGPEIYGHGDEVYSLFQHRDISKKNYEINM